ncbi:MAG: cell envelope integrity protein TolA [Hyphomicrobiaceae bacterium]
MRLALPVSFLLHAAILVWALVSFAATKPLKPAEPEPVEVAIITEDGLTRLRQGDRSSKLLEAKEAPPAPESDQKKPVKQPKLPEPAAPPPPPPEQAESPPPPPPEPAKTEPPPKDPIAEKLAMLPPEPKGPTPEELAKKEAERKEAERKEAEARAKEEEEKKRKAAEAKKLEEKKRREEERKRKLLAKKKLEAKRRAELKRKREAEEKRRKKEDDFFSAMQKALKDNDPTRKAAPTGGAHVASNAKHRGPTAGAPEGADTRLTASQSAMLGLLIKNAVKDCWNINSGAQGVEKIEVKLVVRLRPDGSLAQPPTVYNSMPGPLFADTANSAIRAVIQCARENRFQFPPELYKGGWDQAIWTFDPSKMF